MNNILNEILRVNKLIKALIEQEDIESLNKALIRKNDLIEKYDETNSDDEIELLKKIKKLDEKNIFNLNLLMKKTKSNIESIKLKKGKVKLTNTKLKKYKYNSLNSGYRFDRKK